MSRNLNNPPVGHRDYGATSSSTNAIMPDVSFSGFSPTEFMSLSEDIGQNISAVNSSSRQLEKILKVIGTRREQQATRDMVHNIHAEANTRIDTISRDIQRLTAVVRRGDKQQKLQLEKLTNDFRNVVEKYSSVQKRITAAMRQSIEQLGQQQDEQAEAERAGFLQQQEQITAGLQFEQDMLVDRERQLRQIEADVLDVNAIMRRVYNIVQTQGEQVENIENSVENAATDVELGREELAKASQHRRSYRRKILILLAIAVIIGLIVTGIIVAKLTS
ncbi:syntaxin-12 [Bactrocera oleae]|uniref:syntaxin-12 n=1 Tax=Bactrocera oleae TaxID=104688 RepID=UPI0006B6CFE3|nr:syntaxin-12 [Bactrocera oleae]XP_014099122.1 syntaxin-12 [Bactrocera oleae]XP_036216462.1 syntaxin-12 [Bactrocera oleae]